MASRNQVALDNGKITQAQFDSMAAYKFTCYNNWEDLDVEVDYTNYGIIKCYPVISFGTKDGRIITNPKAFVAYMMDKFGITDYDLSDVSDTCDWSTGVSFTHYNYGWTWINDNAYASDKVKDIIKYTYHNNKIGEYVCDYHQMWE